jgi:hypothetical protein
MKSLTLAAIFSIAGSALLLAAPEQLQRQIERYMNSIRKRARSYRRAREGSRSRRWFGSAR